MPTILPSNIFVFKLIGKSRKLLEKQPDRRTFADFWLSLFGQKKAEAGEVYGASQLKKPAAPFAKKSEMT
ncbi:hypothetical protein [Mucilaginibacter psychrotolerans]|uniref:Uncharacterized protein n=1 Tax=Mucilaginibacter psychrotolerans TaxID=1524096 RepID=A0A4Y8SMD5_9SPHI|nr:hypothetical protein [Mucilaginibacter psychrotolerans]TFF39800.1 hypothetical protein E2R66_05400 [Mucilaginibacter psychrotolerans]